MTNPAVVQEDRNITQKYRTLFNQGVERGGGGGEGGGRD
jgi:hypothetical protein